MNNEVSANNAVNGHPVAIAYEVASQIAEIVQAWLKSASGPVSSADLVSAIEGISAALSSAGVLTPADMPGSEPVPAATEQSVDLEELARIRAEGLGFYDPSYPLPPLEPVIPVSRSVSRKFVTCLADGTRKMMLKRHVKARYNMNWEQYCEWYGLPSTHPSCAPAYAAVKRKEAEAVGLGKIDKTPKVVKTPASARRRVIEDASAWKVPCAA